MTTQQSSRQYIASPGPTQNILPKICRDDVVIHSGFTNHSSSLAPRLRRKGNFDLFCFRGGKKKRKKATKMTAQREPKQFLVTSEGTSRPAREPGLPQTQPTPATSPWERQYSFPSGRALRPSLLGS